GANCAAGSRTGGLFDHAILPYGKNVQVYLCPSRGTNIPGFCGNCSASALAELPRSSYHANCRAVVNGSGTMLAKVPRVAETFLLGEAAGGNYWRSGSDNYGACDNGYMAPHNDGANVAFFDGHVKWLKADKIHNTRATEALYAPWIASDTVMPGW
ncbi:MAG: hypothetical protein HYU66_03465, partial [Armatimonadetes bacterium]|nr:hypothetical protein [Armatimonadota bacterium]